MVAIEGSVVIEHGVASFNEILSLMMASFCIF